VDRKRFLTALIVHDPARELRRRAGHRPIIGWRRSSAIDAAAAAAGRDPAQIATVYNFGGRITLEPLGATRGEDGRWTGSSVRQWIDELTAAVFEHGASGFIYRNTDDTPASEALARWSTEIVPAVREAIAKDTGS